MPVCDVFNGVDKTDISIDAGDHEVVTFGILKLAELSETIEIEHIITGTSTEGICAHPPLKGVVAIEANQGIVANHTSQ